MQNAFNFHTKDCVGNRDAFYDWMRDLGWLYYERIDIEKSYNE